MQILMDFAQAIEQALAEIDVFIQHQLAADARLKRIRCDFVMMHGVGFVKM